MEESAPARHRQRLHASSVVAQLKFLQQQWEGLEFPEWHCYQLCHLRFVVSHLTTQRVQLVSSFILLIQRPDLFAPTKEISCGICSCGVFVNTFFFQGFTSLFYVGPEKKMHRIKFLNQICSFKFFLMRQQCCRHNIF